MGGFRVVLIWVPSISQTFGLSSSPTFLLMASPLGFWPRSLETGKVQGTGVQDGGRVEEAGGFQAGRMGVTEQNELHSLSITPLAL